MEITTTAVDHIQADVITGPGDMRVANGNVSDTLFFFDSITASIRQMVDTLGPDTPLTVELRFGPHGVTVRGETN